MADEDTDMELPSDTVLDETPARALKFFGAVSMNAGIRAAIEQRGYTEAIHEKAWDLVRRASGWRKASSASPQQQTEAAKALAEIDKWDEPHFRIARAALVAMPAQRKFLFDGLEAQQGIGSITSVGTFLDRADELEKGEERKKTRKADQAALAKLAERGIDGAERKRLRGLLAIATGSPEPTQPVSPEVKTKAEEQKTEQREAKIELWLLFHEWSEIARSDISRRDYLIQLGLAKRKVKKPPKGSGGEDTGGGGK